ncbi:M48 family metallopeptidase [Bacillus kwashiorkori]|uniref:M48 family metallopeptidase n=1 Tax=Bacillus kwashiorkori TaxID=1522318 RepID=UPI000785C08B|nr:M48 family metallopeptidase [Bacillus kwashiorkori]
MKKKITLVFIGIYLLFCAILVSYLFIFSNSEIPAEAKGTVLDPKTFLSDNELILSEQYSQIRNLLFFLETPFEWLFYLFLLLFGLGSRFERIAKQVTKIKILQTAIFTFMLSFTTFIVFYPLRYFRYSLAKKYGISTQNFSHWLRDGIIQYWLDWAILFFIAFIVFWLIKKSERRWWLYSWILAMPFAIFYMYIQPVIIDPLFNDFYPLKNKQLEAKILTYANEAGIPAEHVFEVNMSDKTNALNAYVTGVGNNSRIVLWDTTLERLNEEEVLFIMAHEMAHYVEKHIYIGMIGYLVLLFVLLFVVNKLLKWFIRQYGVIFSVRSFNDFTILPLMLLFFSITLFLTSPVINAASRYMEMRADQYAIELTDDAEAGISTFQKLTKSSLSQVHPPMLVKWFRYGHPTMYERMLYLNNYPLETK